MEAHEECQTLIKVVRMKERNFHWLFTRATTLNYSTINITDKNIYPYSYTLSLFLTLPLEFCTCKHSFSGLRCLRSGAQHQWERTDSMSLHFATFIRTVPKSLSQTSSKCSNSGTWITPQVNCTGIRSLSIFARLIHVTTHNYICMYLPHTVVPLKNNLLSMYAW